MTAPPDMLVSEPVLGEDEKAALCAVIDSNWITMGPRVEAFETAFAAVYGMRSAVAVNSCTAGLHLALAALDIGPGDEVLVPSLSFVATANAVVYCGATPVFVDIDSLDRPLMSIEAAALLCTPRTRAVIVMHYAGYLADAWRWRRFADERGIHLIEDSAHAVGAERAPIFGDLAVFSFFGNKNMTTAEGGMILGEDEDLLERIRLRRAHGLTTSTRQRLNGHGIYDVTTLGFNYRMSELNAALGIVQLGKLSDWNAQRKALSKRYRTLLAGSEVDTPFDSRALSTYHIFPVLLPHHIDRSEVVAGLRRAGIQTSFHYPPIHLLSWYRAQFATATLPLTERFSSRQLTLPLHPKMHDAQVHYVTDHLLQIISARSGQHEKNARIEA
jgi:dTDP-4-amino-4,6-dideoxygalactose transaminase